MQVPPEEREFRYRQVLGLPPDVAKTVFVELWVRPSDIFRPTPDPEIDDRTAALDFPPGTPKAHVRWIEKLRGSSCGDGGYPWTRLGYTYDWGGDPQDDVGFSEFIVRAGATVEVHSVTATASYGQ